MAQKTGIEWTDHTFNPWWGCTKVSPACDSCYAERFSKRVGFTIWGQGAERRLFGERHWHEPFRWNAAAEREGVRHKVFCGSMCDVMEDRRELDTLRGDLYQAIESTPWLDWQLLTKRPHNFLRLLPERWSRRAPMNLWLGTTVEKADCLWRVEALVAAPAALHFVSYEPALGPVDFTPWLEFERCGGGHRIGNARLRWVIAGGESGPGARPAYAEWFRDVRDQCNRAGVPFFFKQWGDWLPGDQDGGFDRDGSQVLNCGAEPIRAGKRAAGALLDGREHREFPEVR